MELGGHKMAGKKMNTKLKKGIFSAVAVVVFFFFMPAFSVAFALIYLYYTLFHKHKVLVGTCQDCGQETLFNRPDDGSLEPDFDKPWTS